MAPPHGVTRDHLENLDFHLQQQQAATPILPVSMEAMPGAGEALLSLFKEVSLET